MKTTTTRPTDTCAEEVGELSPIRVTNSGTGQTRIVQVRVTSAGRSGRLARRTRTPRPRRRVLRDWLCEALGAPEPEDKGPTHEGSATLNRRPCGGTGGEE